MKRSIGFLMGIILSTILTSNGFSQQHDSQNKADSSSRPVVISYTLLDDILSFSLTDSVLYKNFEKEIEAHRNKDRNTLVTVTKGESEQRLEFVSLFYEIKSRQKNIKKAYHEALAEMRKRHGSLDFKSKLFMKE